MVKANQPGLHAQLAKLPWARIPAVSSVSTDHGRSARRTIKAVLASAWIGFAGAAQVAQVAQVRRTVTKKGKKTVEVVYLITSDSDVGPASLAAWIRGHREIENKLHWVRDVTYQEDKSLVRTGNARRVMASCAAWPSTSCAWTATPTSPPPTVITPATRSARSRCFRPHERLCRVPGGQAEPSSAWTRQATSPTEAVEN